MTLILRFTCALDPLYGGVPQGVALISKETSLFGISNVIVSLGNSRNSRLRNEKNLEALRSAGVNVIETHSVFSNPYGIGNFLPHVKALLKIEKPNLIVIHQIWTFGTLFGYIYSKLYSVELAIMPHGSLSTYHESKSSYIKFIARKILISKVLSHASHIIATSEMEKIDLSEELKKKTVTIPYACNPNLPKKKITPSNKILFAGRITKKKNLDLLIKAMSSIKEYFPKAILIVAGDGHESEVEPLRDLANELGLQSDIVFTGWQSRDQIILTMQEADVFILPSEYENFGHSVMESLSCGTPVVISKYVALSSIVKERQAGVVIENNESEEIATAVKHVLSNWELYSSNAEVAALEEFSWDKVSRMWADLSARR